MMNILFSFTWQTWCGRKLYSIFTHIYARDVKKKGEDHTYCYAFSFEYHLLHLKTLKSLLHWRKIIKCRQLSFSTSERRCLNSNVILHFCANVTSCPECALFVSRAKNKKTINQLQIDAVTDVNDNGCLTDRSMHWRYRTLPPLFVKHFKTTTMDQSAVQKNK